MTDLDPRGQRRRRTLQAVAALGAIGALGLTGCSGRDEAPSATFRVATIHAAYDYLLELRLDRGPLGEEEAERELRAWWAARQP